MPALNYHKLFCVAITCPFLTDLINGSLTYSDVRDQSGSYAFNVVATYSCNTGFVLMGDAVRICTGDGSNTTGTFNVMASSGEWVVIVFQLTTYILFRFRVWR